MHKNKLNILLRRNNIPYASQSFESYIDPNFPITQPGDRACHSSSPGDCAPPADDADAPASHPVDAVVALPYYDYESPANAASRSRRTRPPLPAPASHPRTRPSRTPSR
mmetsp:Transcript_5266/g.11522  ORF Transcript_5266/g.11522 Transcript_5266/m.11522 type:complete len:109 (+) Transcript_5266:109-435(+)